MAGMDLNQNRNDFERDRLAERVNKMERFLESFNIETLEAIGDTGKLRVKNISSVNGSVQQVRGKEIDVTATATDASIDWDTVALGYKLDPGSDDPDKVRIYAGEIDRVAVTQTDVTVTDDDYVYVRRTISDDTMLVTSGASVPANGVTYRYYRLYRMTVTAGTASIKNIYRPFDIEAAILNVDGLSGSQYQVLQLDALGDVTVDWLRAGPAT